MMFLLRNPCEQVKVRETSLFAQVTTYGRIPGQPGAAPWPASSPSATARLHREGAASAANQRSRCLLRR